MHGILEGLLVFALILPCLLDCILLPLSFRLFRFPDMPLLLFLKPFANPLDHLGEIMGGGLFEHQFKGLDVAELPWLTARVELSCHFDKRAFSHVRFVGLGILVGIKIRPRSHDLAI